MGNAAHVPALLAGVAGISRDEIVAASEVIAGRARVTPLLESGVLNARTGGRVLIKPECLQRTGSFKFRGAYNRIAAIPIERRTAGIVAWSSGNHAQGVACAARLFGSPATIVMPNDAARIKVAGVKNFGAEIVFYDRRAEGREELGNRVLQERGGTFVHPYDDPLVVAGQGTAGLEAAQQMRARDIVPDVALVPCGGGGLLSGVTVGLRSEFPQIDVRSVEPEVHDDMARSLAEGRHIAADEGAATICDSLLPPRVGEIAYAVGTKFLGPGLVVSDAEVLEAVAFALLRLKLVVEPGGAAALAAALSGRIDLRDKTALLVVSGGNADAAMLARALAEAREAGIGSS